MMNNADMRGIFSALLVSYNEDGSINEKGLREIIRHNIDNMKVDGLYVGGSTGENFMISTEEKKRIFEIAKDEAKDQIKLIAQVGSINVYESVELAKFATALGYDAISAVTPFYYKFSFNEIKDYYNTIINSVNNRLIIYSIPFLTGVDMTVEQFGELFENEKINDKSATRKWTKLESAIKLEGSSILKYENINFKKYHINTIFQDDYAISRAKFKKIRKNS